MIGIFGGAFDPPHSEHIRIAREVAAAYHLDRVIFVPSGVSPHKSLETPFALRVRMLRAAIGEEPFAIDEIEGTLSERAYSYRVLPMLKEKYGEIAFLIGGDSLLAFDSWRNPEDVAKICPLIVVPRADESLDELRAKAAEVRVKYGADVRLCETVRGEAVSSSCVRARVSLGMPVPEISDEVLAVIRDADLYGEYREMAERVRGYLPEKRWRHTCGVVLAGLRINERVGIDKGKVIVSCLLHDCMKYEDRVNEGVPADVVGTKILHAFNGAEEARLAFGVTDPEVLDAIRYHTTGRAGMTPLDKLVYTADMVEEETRDFEGVEELRAAAYRDLDEGFRLCFLACYEQLKEGGKPIYHLTIDCFDDMFGGK
ncbi:MAG: nicotinate (nicotinamide) nucleotide adenylyltransferase [Clostridia bacterium]|nr:nicotinate (nicotinamide) nucleotide adenylyltransferase [Clostridia bacterium]